MATMKVKHGHKLVATRNRVKPAGVTVAKVGKISSKNVKGKIPYSVEMKLVKKAAKHIAQLHRNAFKELERY